MNRALPIVALVLLASVVTGRETARAPGVTPPEAAAQPAEAPSATADLPDLNVIRSRRGGSTLDLFAGQAPAAPAPPPAVVGRAEPSPIPVAPPLPFSYLGRMRNGERAIVYLRKNGQGMLIAESGATLDNQYLVEGISDTAVQFIYLPLGTKQALSLPAAP